MTSMATDGSIFSNPGFLVPATHHPPPLIPVITTESRRTASDADALHEHASLAAPGDHPWTHDLCRPPWVDRHEGSPLPQPKAGVGKSSPQVAEMVNTSPLLGLELSAQTEAANGHVAWGVLSHHNPLWGGPGPPRGTLRPPCGTLRPPPSNVDEDCDTSPPHRGHATRTGANIGIVCVALGHTNPLWCRPRPHSEGNDGPPPTSPSYMGENVSPPTSPPSIRARVLPPDTPSHSAASAIYVHPAINENTPSLPAGGTLTSGGPGQMLSPSTRALPPSPWPWPFKAERRPPSRAEILRHGGLALRARALVRQQERRTEMARRIANAAVPPPPNIPLISARWGGS